MIQRVKSTDAGRYICEAMFTDGTALTAATRLHVISKC